MLFPTIEFAIFLSIVFPVTWALNRRNTLKKYFLLLASYFFYGFWSTDYLLILLLSPIFNFYLGKALGYVKERNHRLVILWFGITVNLAILNYFKYYNFLKSDEFSFFEAFVIRRWSATHRSVRLSSSSSCAWE
jgi:alginate O-acetyltransferase complex protein AlgI